MRRVPQVARAQRSSPTSSAVLGGGATPRSRQIPAKVARTTPWAVGESCPAARCITAIAASLRRSVEGRPFRSARKRGTVCGLAGNASTVCAAHHVLKVRQSAAYARKVAGARAASA
jgi:hypothetical protein